MELFERYGPQYKILQDLFLLNCERLNQIFVCTEDLWEKNLDRLKGKEVKYLLIAEAPPWAPENDALKYFYNNNTVRQNLRTTVWNTFYDTPRPGDPEEVLEGLAEKQFLLIDTLPFSVNYSNKRESPVYEELIKQCSSFFCDKLKHPGITWSPEVKVAFALKLNYRAIMRAYSDIKCLKSKIADFDENNIAAAAAGFPNSTKMRRIFDL